MTKEPKKSKESLTSESPDILIEEFVSGQTLKFSFYQKITLLQKGLVILLLSLIGWAAWVIFVLADGISIGTFVISPLGIWMFYLGFGREFLEKKINRFELEENKGISVRFWELYRIRKIEIPLEELWTPERQKILRVVPFYSAGPQGGSLLGRNSLEVSVLREGTLKKLFSIQRGKSAPMELEKEALEALFESFGDTFREGFVIEESLGKK